MKHHPRKRRDNLDIRVRRPRKQKKNKKPETKSKLLNMTDLARITGLSAGTLKKHYYHLPKEILPGYWSPEVIKKWLNGESVPLNKKEHHSKIDKQAKKMLGEAINDYKKRYGKNS